MALIVEHINTAAATTSANGVLITNAIIAETPNPITFRYNNLSTLFLVTKALNATNMTITPIISTYIYNHSLAYLLNFFAILPKTEDALGWSIPIIVKIAITIPTINISGVMPTNEQTKMMKVMDKLPKVPAYPGSAHNLFPINTKKAAMIPPGIPKSKYPIEANNVPADASGEHKMFPWKNPPAMSPPLFSTSYPTILAPKTPGCSGSPKYVSITTKFNQQIIAAIIIPIISFINYIPFIFT